MSFSHVFSFHVDRVGFVDQPIQDGVGQCGIADCGVPLVDGQLAGGDGGASAVALFEHLEQVAAIFGVGLDQSRIVDDKNLGPGEPGQQFGVASVALGDGQFAQQLARRKYWAV